MIGRKMKAWGAASNANFLTKQHDKLMADYEKMKKVVAISKRHRYPRNRRRLVGQHRFDGETFIIGEFVARDLSPGFGSLNHRRPTKRNAPGPGSGLALSAQRKRLSE